MLQLRYFGHLMWRANSLEKTLMLGKIEGRRRGWWRMRWFYGIIKHHQFNAHGSGDLVAKLCLTRAIPWTVACQTPLSMGFSRQEYWSGLPFPSPEDLSDPGIKPRSPALQADSLSTELWGKSTQMSLSKLWEIVKDREAWRAVVHGVETEQQQQNCGTPGSSVHGTLQAISEVGYHCLLQGIFPTERSNPMSPALAARFFTPEPPGKSSWY